MPRQFGAPSRFGSARPGMTMKRRCLRKASSSIASDDDLRIFCPDLAAAMSVWFGAYEAVQELLHAVIGLRNDTRFRDSSRWTSLEQLSRNALGACLLYTSPSPRD